MYHIVREEFIGVSEEHHIHGGSSKQAWANNIETEFEVYLWTIRTAAGQLSASEDGHFASLS
jgi:hypothetical protein